MKSIVGCTVAEMVRTYPRSDRDGPVRVRRIGFAPMGRLVWVAIGAAGGIWAYRRASDLIESAREQGVALTVQQVALSTTQAVNQISSSFADRGGSSAQNNPTLGRG